MIEPGRAQVQILLSSYCVLSLMLSQPGTTGFFVFFSFVLFSKHGDGVTAKSTIGVFRAWLFKISS